MSVIFCILKMTFKSIILNLHKVGFEIFEKRLFQSYVSFFSVGNWTFIGFSLELLHRQMYICMYKLYIYFINLFVPTNLSRDSNSRSRNKENIRKAKSKIKQDFCHGRKKILDEVGNTGSRGWWIRHTEV
jgi:hypothetical protein